MLICAGFSGVFAILELLIAFNPKLKKWSKLEHVSGKENEYVRPKKFPLAYSEWGTFLILFLSEFSFNRL